MFKRVLSVRLVLSGLVFFQVIPVGFGQTLEYFPIERGSNRERADRLYEYVTGMWPADLIWADMRAAFTEIADSNDEGAQAAVNKLQTDFAQNQYLPIALYETSKLYSQLGRQDQASRLRKYIINQWPTHKYTMWALMDVARLHVSVGKSEPAQAAIDKLKAGFSSDEDITGAVACIAHEYLNRGEYVKGLSLCTYILTTLPKNQDTMWAQSGVVVANIGLGNIQVAETATQDLIGKFPGHERLPEAVYDVAHRYQGSGHLEKAEQLYRQVLDTWPQWENITWATIGLAQSNIGLGNNAAAKTIVDGMVSNLNTKFPDDSNLPGYASEAYYHAGQCYRGLGEWAKSTDCLQKVGDSCPEYHMRWKALFLMGRNYEDLKRSGLVVESEADLKIKAVYEQLLDKYPDCEVAETVTRHVGPADTNRFQIREIEE